MKKEEKIKYRFKDDYKDSIVVFLDLMGIRDFTLTAREHELFEIYNVINLLVTLNPGIHIDTENNPSYPIGMNVKIDLKEIFKGKLIITSLSDSIIFSIHKDYLILLPYILRLVALTQLLFLTKGLPIRGAISSGKIFHKLNDPITFGEGLVKVAELEKIAKFPRVLVDNSLLSEYQNIYRFPANIKRAISFFKKTYPHMAGFRNLFEMFSNEINNLVITDHMDGKNIVNILDNERIKSINKAVKINFNKEYTDHLQAIKQKYQGTTVQAELDILKKWAYLESMLASTQKE